jgi:hypothetical protein
MTKVATVIDSMTRTKKRKKIRFTFPPGGCVVQALLPKAWFLLRGIVCEPAGKWGLQIRDK